MTDDDRATLAGRVMSEETKDNVAVGANAVVENGDHGSPGSAITPGRDAREAQRLATKTEEASTQTATIDDLFKDEPADMAVMKSEDGVGMAKRELSPDEVKVSRDDFESDGDDESVSETSIGVGGKNKRIVKIKIPRQIHLDEPSAKEEALSVFEELEACHYQSNNIGEPEQEEIMTCDCRPQLGKDGVNRACGPDSDCINRVTSIECVDGECGCGDACANQRFQRRTYADVDVFQAGLKGFGLRVMTAVQRPNTFVYEYLGEVINERKFRQRQVEYQEQGERHFYFMMLQRGEYIDATKRGGLGRFINHSCNPNCYVDKWVVGNKLRMGIFTKRAVARGEELTFDYNVDRYGGDATPCYCGEPTCIGYIGGKTQTEANNKLPQNIIDALGIDDGVEYDDGGPKKHRKKRRDEDDEEYVADLQPRGIEEKDVPKIMHTLMQSSERWILIMVLRRILDGADDRIHSKMISLHGYQTLGSKLDKWKEDDDLTTLILEVLHRWPRVTKNKISSSKIETYVQEVAKMETASQRVRVLANDLIETWSQLEMAYRIPRRVRPAKPETTDADDAQTPGRGGSEMTASVSQASNESPGPNKDDASRPRPTAPRRPAAPSWRSNDSFSRNRPGHPTGPRRDRPPPAVIPPPTPDPKPTAPTMPIISENLQAIIDAAKKQQEDQAEQARLAEVKRQEEKEQQDKAEARRREDRARRHKEHKEHKERKRLQALAGGNHSVTPSSASTPMVSSSNGHGHGSGSSGRDAKDERILLGNFAKVVPNAIAKYGERLGKEEIKRRAKEICKILVAKEMRKSHDQRDLSSDMAEAKKLKVKQFAKEFMHKVLKHQDAKLQRKGSVTDEHHADGSTGHDGDVADQATEAPSPAQDAFRSATSSPAEFDSRSPDRVERSLEATPSSKRSVAELEGGDHVTSHPGEDPDQRPGKQQKLDASDEIDG